MTFAAVVASIASLPVSEQRQRRETYVELVFFTRDTARWTEALSAHLGTPAKAAGTAPSESQRQAASPYGGIHANQTLFQGSPGGATVIAMFWPWQDGQHTTLKLAKVG